MSSTTGADHGAMTGVRDLLSEKTAVITGASRGIGLAVARAFHAAGARVALVARSGDSLRDIVATLGDRASAVVCDVTDMESVGVAIDRVRREFGGVPHILVNNAGAFDLATVEQMDPDTFTRAVTTNLIAPFLFVRTLLAGMRERGAGDIVTIGSMVDRVAFAENAAYAASKHGVRALHEVLRLELRGSGVRATLVSPGPVDTGAWDRIDPDNRPGFTPRTSMLRAAAVADAVLYAVTRSPDVNIDELRLSHS
jgi:NADP-dependent 3-hydroxy acid dehydrogenase YdfG